MGAMKGMESHGGIIRAGYCALATNYQLHLPCSLLFADTGVAGRSRGSKREK